MATYNAVDVGITDQGITLEQESAWEMINQSDSFGDSVIDGVYRGGNVHLSYESKAFKAGSMTPFWPWGALGLMQTYRADASAGSVAPIGRLASAVAAASVLNAMPNSAYNTTGALAILTLTAPGSLLAPNSPARLLFNSKLRQVPIRLICLPYEATVSLTTTTRWFAYT